MLPAIIVNTAKRELLPAVNDIVNTAEQALDLCRAVDVIDHETFELAAENRNMLNDVIKELERVRKEITAPLDQHKIEIMEFFKSYANRVLERKTSLETQMLAHKRKLDEERAAEQRRIEEEARARENAERERLADLAVEALNKGNEKVAESLLIKADAYREPELILTPVHIPSAEVATKKLWKYEVVDFSLLPDLFKKVDDKALQAVASARKEMAVVPGVRFYYDEIFAGKGKR